MTLFRTLDGLRERVRDNDVQGLEQDLKTLANENSDWFKNLSYELTSDVNNLMRDAIVSGKRDMVQLFLDAGVWAQGSSKDGVYFIQHAAGSGHLEIVQLLVEHGAPVRGREREDKFHDYGLRAAVINGHAEIVDYLLESGAVIGYGDPLMKAAAQGNERIILSLLRHGDQLLSLSNGDTDLIEDDTSKIKRNYSLKQRIDLIKYAFKVLRGNHSKYYFKSNMKLEAKQLFQELNESLRDLDLIEKSEERKKQFTETFINKLEQFGFTQVDPGIVMKALVKLIATLREFEEKKLQLEKQRSERLNAYTSMLRVLMDHAMGHNLIELFSCEEIDVTGINFIGVCYKGIPITHDLLRSQGIKGTEHALVTLDDLNSLTDLGRRNELKNRLELAMQKSGKLISAEGIVNLVPLGQAVEIGDIDAVKARLSAGMDPHDANLSLIESAAKNGHLEIVKLLMASYAEHAQHGTQRLIAEAKIELQKDSDSHCLYVNKGRIKKIPSLFGSEDYWVIALKHDAAQFASLSRAYGGISTIDKEIKGQIGINKLLSQNCVIVFQKHSTYNLTMYDKESPTTKIQALFDTSLQNARSYDSFPILFTNKNNIDLISHLIETQNKKWIRNVKKSIISAIAVARRNKHHSIADYLESQQGINEVDEEGRTLLHHAVISENLEKVRELITKGADVNIKRRDGKSPIDIAAGDCYSEGKDNFQIIQCLLDNKAQVYLNTLHIAIKSGSENALELLLPYARLEDVEYTDYSQVIAQRSRPWYVDLMYNTLRSTHTVKLLTVLKRYGADFNCKEWHVQALLLEVIQSLPSSLNTLHYLLDNGTNVKIVDESGITPLYLLIRDKKLQSLPNNGYEEILDKLLANGAEVNARSDTQSTPLHAAAKTQDLIALNYLLKHGAELHAQNNEGNTPLHLAASQMNAALVKALIQAGAQTSLLNEKRCTPLNLLQQSYKDKKNKLKEDQRHFDKKDGDPMGFFGNKSTRTFYKQQKASYAQLESDYKECLEALSVMTNGIKP